jgi:hypothetical protein
VVTRHLLILNKCEYKIYVGLMGTSQDLEYLGCELKKDGCVVLQSSSNQLLKTLSGVREGGYSLASEIQIAVSKLHHLQKISIVGNSLGGLYARYAIGELYDSSRGTIAGLQPHCFMTIASPHLGIRDYTYFDIPNYMKSTLSLPMLTTGKDLILNDAANGDARESLLYKMAASNHFLAPLKSFKKKQLYANLDKDFAVPLATAAFLVQDEVKRLRGEHSRRFGIVDELETNASPDKSPTDSGDKGQHLDNTATNEMICGLDSCGWKKIIVHFNTPWPFAHNKISALRRGPEWVSDMLGFSEGTFVMDHAAKCLITDDV